MLFLRLTWMTGQAGIVLASVIVLISSLVTTLTTMSMAAICTNGEVKGGQYILCVGKCLYFQANLSYFPFMTDKASFIVRDLMLGRWSLLHDISQSGTRIWRSHWSDLFVSQRSGGLHACRGFCRDYARSALCKWKLQVLGGIFCARLIVSVIYNIQTCSGCSYHQMHCIFVAKM